MLSVIAFFAAAATPACPVPSAPADAIAISATKMPVEAAGGAYVARDGWRALAEVRIGLIRYRWAFTPQSDDSRFINFNLSPGPIHSRLSGCWFVWDYQ